jgi:hypothetical protein
LGPRPAARRHPQTAGGTAASAHLVCNYIRFHSLQPPLRTLALSTKI